MTTLTLLNAACASAPNAGSLGEGSAATPKIVGVDTARPPRSATVEIEQPAYAALLLVAPGHSASLLYPPDSVTNNQLAAGTSTLSFTIAETLVPSDSGVLVRRPRATRDTTLRTTRGDIARSGAGPIPPDTPTFLLLVTSPQRLDYNRIRERTTGVSLPIVESEALNAVGKTIKATIPAEPRSWAGFFHRVELTRQK